ncbi:long-chain-fatty-acid--CoA ligase 4-like [Sarcoptes scabiei]|nr:long-chain-fatty-acid--CoA ligase 4-like [Sarcoptes scabiei]
MNGEHLDASKLFTLPLHHYYHNHSGSKFDTLPRSINEMAKSLRESRNIVRKINYKHYWIMIVFFACLVLLMVYLLHQDARKCTIDPETANACFKQLTILSEFDRYPQTNKQLDQYCEEKTKSIKCSRTFVERCMDVDRQQWSFFRNYAKNFKNLLEKICIHRSDRQKFMDYSECLMNNKVIEKFSNCNDQFHNRLINIAQRFDIDNRIPSACCAFNHRMDCLREPIENLTCYNEIKIFISDRIKDSVGGIFESICGPNYLSIDQCQNNLDEKVWDEIFVQSISNNTSKRIELNSKIESNELNHQELPIKFVELKFFENFLAFLYIIKSE